MAKTKKRTKATGRNKRVATKAAVKVTKGVRARASRRRADGKFTKIIFNQIGGKGCRRFAAMTWAERDAFGEARKRRSSGTLRKAYGFAPVNRFNPDKVVATPGGLAALEASGESLIYKSRREVS